LRVQPRRSMGTNGAVAVPAVVAVENGEPLSPAAQAGPIYGACRDRTGDLRLATHPDTRPHLTVKRISLGAEGRVTVRRSLPARLIAQTELST
jgi:hypothetical protein